jgi:flagellar motor switch protein FliG
MASLPSIEKKDVDRVLDEFSTALQTQTSVGLGTQDYVRAMLEPSIGRERAEPLFDHMFVDANNSKGLDMLKWMQPKAVAELIHKEHPQIIAIILSHLDSAQSAQILLAMPEKLRIDIMLRITHLDGIQPAAMQELNGVLKKQFAHIRKIRSRAQVGIAKAAHILDLMGSAEERSLFDQIAETDASLGHELQSRLSVFSKLSQLSDANMQTLLKYVPVNVLCAALSAEDEQTKKRIQARLSRSVLASLNKMRLSKPTYSAAERHAAHLEILAVAKQLAENGSITLPAANIHNHV